MALFKVTLLGVLNNIPCMNRWFMENQGGFNTPEAIAEVIRSQWCTLIQPQTTNELTWTGCQIQQLTPIKLDGTIIPYLAPVTGAVFGAPAVCSIVFSFKTNMGIGGKWIGRQYNPPPNQLHFSAGKVSTSGFTAWNGYAQNFMSRFCGSNPSSGLQAGIFVGAQNPVWQVIQAVRCNRYIGVIRNRRVPQTPTGT